MSDEKFKRRIIGYKPLLADKVQLVLECKHTITIDRSVTDRDLEAAGDIEFMECPTCRTHNLGLSKRPVSDRSNDIEDWKNPYLSMISGLIVCLGDQIASSLKKGPEGPFTPLEDINNMARTLNELFNLEVYIREGGDWDDLFDDRIGLGE